jgi:hypothetical protein
VSPTLAFNADRLLDRLVSTPEMCARFESQREPLAEGSLRESLAVSQP